MISKIDEKRAEVQARIDKEVLAALEYELEGAIGHAGGVLTGFSMKIGNSDCLMTLRAIVSGRHMVSFVGCPDMSSCFRKAVVEAYHDGLVWKEDQFASKDD